MAVTFSRTRLNGLWLRNRLVRSPTYEAMATPAGAVTPALTKCYTDLADGRVGLVFTGCTLTDPRGRHHPTMLSLLSPESQGSIGRVASEVHRHQAHFGVQLVHAGLSAKAQYINAEPEGPDTMSRSDIERVIDNFIRGAKTTFAIGADCVELHGSGGYLLAGFLSPKTNHRTDEFGGSQAKRNEIVRRIVTGIRKVVIPTFPVLIKINASTAGPFAMAPADVIEVVKTLEESGIDAIELFVGMPPKGKANYSTIKEVRKVTKLPLISAGGYLKLEDIENAVGPKGYCDLVSLSRPLVRQPDLPKLFQQGKTKIADCVNCNGCVGATSMKEKPLRCVVKK
jgi:2,4-dienoyl-CoA reductase-like NADH-dependent reductase (Old Yellow Enzyme family)